MILSSRTVISSLVQFVSRFLDMVLIGGVTTVCLRDGVKINRRKEEALDMRSGSLG